MLCPLSYGRLLRFKPTEQSLVTGILSMNIEVVITWMISDIYKYRMTHHRAPLSLFVEIRNIESFEKQTVFLVVLRVKVPDAVPVFIPLCSIELIKRD